MEFWPELLTKASWERLISLKKEFDFILIGGWAAYLHTGLHKSKDIDIIVDYNTLKKLKQEYDLVKNNRLKKYEIKSGKFDIDIYVPYFSDLAIPLEDLNTQTVMIKGINTLRAEPLLILKQGAEIDRRNSIKGEKDAIDIITIMLHSDINWKTYMKLLKKYKKEKFRNELIFVINNFSDKNIHYLGIDFNKFKKWKKKVIGLLKRL
ncbi:MAG: hypothetical protein KKE93_02015 [Nanoarchaeota archaeon]|nr:hypothetical protein [Nanoarchaeota archaeon]